MASNRLTWMLKTMIVSGLIVLLNYPVVHGVCHDISQHYTTLIVTILVLSVLYGFSALCSPQHFHAILIGLLAGNLIALLTWIVSFRDVIFHFSDPDKLSFFYSLGVLIPSTVQFFTTFKQNDSQTKKLHIALTSMITISLFGYIVYRFFHQNFYDTNLYNFFHLILGLVVGIITVSVIRFVITYNILVFEKLSLYLEAMLKPIIAFFLGYLLIMFTFSGIYTLAYLSDNTIFNHLYNDPFGELMFYSFSVITGMTFSVVEPQHPITFFLTTAEHFLGLVWMTVVFAAALAHLQLPFRKISMELNKLIKDKDKENPSL